MPERPALLVTADPALIESIEDASPFGVSRRLEICRCPQAALERLQSGDAAVVLLHATTGDGDAGLTHLIAAAAALPRPCPAVVLADEYDDLQAVAFLRCGAAEYVSLPLDLARLGLLLDLLTLKYRPALHPAAGLAEPAPCAACHDLSHFVLDSEMTELMEQLRRVAAGDTTLLFTGETGTGKTRLARLIHELSPRRDQPFLVVDCGVLSASLIESEIFGHIKGAFTGADRDRAGKFAAAAGGTLLLDEVNSLPPALQSKLLRAVDERVFEPVGSNRPQPLRARLIVASNTPLEREVADGRFRADLFYRLNVVGFFLTPLRERRAAVPMLANRFLAEFSARSGRDFTCVVPEAMRLLQAYDWPGNIRELRNVIERAVALSPGNEIQVADLPEAVRETGPTERARPVLRASREPAPHRSLLLSRSKDEVEILRITEALEKHSNNRLRAAAELGISRMALYKKLHKYGMMGTG